MITEAERAAALADKIAAKLPIDRFDRITLTDEHASIVVTALRAYAATPTVTDEMVEAAAIAIRKTRNPYITPEANGSAYDQMLARAALEAVLGKETANG